MVRYGHIRILWERGMHAVGKVEHYVSAEAVVIVRNNLVLKIPPPSFEPRSNPNFVKSTQDPILGILRALW